MPDPVQLPLGLVAIEIAPGSSKLQSSLNRSPVDLILACRVAHQLLAALISDHANQRLIVAQRSWWVVLARWSRSIKVRPLSHDALNEPRSKLLLFESIIGFRR